jgi:hypothetical protein
MAQALVDADRELQVAALRYEEALDHGTDADVDDALRGKELARAAYLAARRPLQGALIITRSMTDETALYVALALIAGDKWMFDGYLRRIHLEARERELQKVSGWDESQPFIPRVVVTEETTYATQDGSVAVKLTPGGGVTVLIAHDRTTGLASFYTNPLGPGTEGTRYEAVALSEVKS